MSGQNIRLANAFFTAHKMLSDRGYNLEESQKDVMTLNEFFIWKSNNNSVREYTKGDEICQISFHEKGLSKTLISDLLTEVSNDMKKHTTKGRLIIISPKITSSLKKIIDKFQIPPGGFMDCEHSVKNGQLCFGVEKRTTRVRGTRNVRKKVPTNIIEEEFSSDEDDEKVHDKKPGISIDFKTKKIPTICIDAQCIFPVVEFFTLTSLQFNYMKHSLVPKYTHITSEGFKKNLLETLLKETVVKETDDIPTLFDLLSTQVQRDPCSKWFGANIGDLFYIERTIPEFSTSVRIVIPDYSRKKEKPLKRV